MGTESNTANLLATPDHNMNDLKVNELYLKYNKMVYNLALTYVKDTYLAEDLSHEILVKCYLARKKFNGDCSFHTWMYRIAINHCIDFLRKGYRYRDLPHEHIDFLNEKDVSTPESEVLTNFDHEELRNKLKQLPSHYEEVLILYYFKEQSMKEIEHHLNIKLSTIKTRLFRAKRMLKEMF